MTPKHLLMILLLSPTIAAAGPYDKEEVSVREMSNSEKIQLCEDFADAKFCGSRIDERKCLGDYTFEVKFKRLKKDPKLITQQNFKMTSRSGDFKFTKKEFYQVYFGGGKAASRYTHESYQTEGYNKLTQAPTFVVDTGCRGDIDRED